MKFRIEVVEPVPNPLRDEKEVVQSTVQFQKRKTYTLLLYK